MSTTWRLAGSCLVYACVNGNIPFCINFMSYYIFTQNTANDKQPLLRDFYSSIKNNCNNNIFIKERINQIVPFLMNKLFSREKIIMTEGMNK